MDGIRIDNPTIEESGIIIKENFPNIYDPNSEYNYTLDKNEDMFLTKEKRNELIKDIIEELTDINWAYVQEKYYYSVLVRYLQKEQFKNHIVNDTVEYLEYMQE